MPKGRTNRVSDALGGTQVSPVVPQVEDHPVVSAPVVDNNERGAVSPELAQPAPVVETPSEEFVTLTAADPKVKLEVSINGEIWVGNSITIPKANESDVRRLLNDAGMYVKN